MTDEIPEIIKKVGFDFYWDENKVWKLEVPVSEMDVSELSWHFDIPFLWEHGVPYSLTPKEMMAHPESHAAEMERTMKADTAYPIDIMENKGRWLILDGLHRLIKATILGEKKVRVRVIPREKIPEISKDQG